MWKIQVSVLLRTEPPVVCRLYKKHDLRSAPLRGSNQLLQTEKQKRQFLCHSHLLGEVFVRDDGSIVEKGMIEGVWEQPAELHHSPAACGAPAVLQAEADEAQTTDSHAEEQQIVLLLSLVPASLTNTVGRPIIFTTSLGNPSINSGSLALNLDSLPPNTQVHSLATTFNELSWQL